MSITNKKILKIIILITFIIFSYFWLQHGAKFIQDHHDPYNPIQQLIVILLFTGFGIFLTS